MHVGATFLTGTAQVVVVTEPSTGISNLPLQHKHRHSTLPSHDSHIWQHRLRDMMVSTTVQLISIINILLQQQQPHRSGLTCPTVV